MAKYPVFGVRFCTYCGEMMDYIINENNHPFGFCLCGNTDYCDNETVEDTKKRFGEKLKIPKYKYIIVD